MSQNLVERRKELKRRRKRRQERIKARKKKAVPLKPVPTISPAVPSKPGPATQIIAKHIETTPKNFLDPYRIEWQQIHTITDMIHALPENIKPKKVWQVIPEELKAEVIKRARHLAASRSFAAPAEWDGSLKQALLLMERERLPNGFKNFLSPHGLT